MHSSRLNVKYALAHPRNICDVNDNTILSSIFSCIFNHRARKAKIVGPSDAKLYEGPASTQWYSLPGGIEHMSDVFNTLVIGLTSATLA